MTPRQSTKPKLPPGLYWRPNSQHIWCKYYLGARPVRESTGTGRLSEAKRFLDARRGAAATGAPVIPRADRMRSEEAAADLRAHYGTTGTRNIGEVAKRLQHLDAFFVGRRLAGIGGAEATAYVARRQAQGAANGTINRELGVLVRAMRLAHERGRLLRLPVIRKLKEAAPRQGFFEREQFEAVRRRLPADLQVAVSIAYTFGWRTQSEVLTLERRHLDLEPGTLRLDPGTTKNDDGRLCYLPPDLKSQLAAQVERVEHLSRTLGRIIPSLFPHLTGPLQGTRCRDFKDVWRRACRQARVPGMLRHDLPRTTVRNLVNAGVSERVAMTISGHKTRAVFDRCHIVSPADLVDAAHRLHGHISGTVGGKAGLGRSGTS